MVYLKGVLFLHQAEIFTSPVSAIENSELYGAKSI